MARPIRPMVSLAGGATLLGLLASVLLGVPSARAGSLADRIPAAQTTLVSLPVAPAPHRTATTTGTTIPATTAPTSASRPVTTVAPRLPPVTAARSATPVQYRQAASSGGSQATTAPAPMTTTTVAPIGNSLPPSPVTPALRTRGSNAHVSPVFAILSGIGFLVALLIVAARLFVTRPGGPDRRPYPVTPAGDEYFPAGSESVDAGHHPRPSRSS